ncbi:MAG: leucine--tRNA ligase [Phycisphaerales bacterium]|nr:leucine--tRNA ligase [Phycisphaerales bacterium]
MSQKSSTPSNSPSTPSEETPHRYAAAFACTLELAWQQRWEQDDLYRTHNPGDAGFDASKPKFYCLDMFPYPSGAGLHVGHPEGYTATDILCRYKRMQGCNVLHPMGWDAFGLPAEQYAIQTGVHPRETTRNAIATFKRQLQRFGFSYDWNREFATIEPEYYHWTQWIWLQCYHAYYDASVQRARPIAELEAKFVSQDVLMDVDGSATQVRWSAASPLQRQQHLDRYRLAYLGTQTVNWCPKLGTVLANEEVINGRSERGGFPVMRKPLRQWMFRITAYADRLLEDLALVQWPESTRAMQSEWIGRSEGAEIRFDVLRGASVEGDALSVFTTRSDTLFGATFMVIAPEHPLVAHMLEHPHAETDVAAVRLYIEAAKNRSDIDRQSTSKKKTGVFTGAYARNPATGASIPIWVADYVLMGYGTGAIMAVPAHDERDFEFAKDFGLAIVQVVEIAGLPFDGTHAVSGEGVAINSASALCTLNGLTTSAAQDAMTCALAARKVGAKRVQYKLRDWLFSRQRYWGEPFPVVFDADGLHHPVGEAHLPVLLPALADFHPVESDQPVPPLGKARAWVETTAHAAGVAGLPPETAVRRETNTMPNWAGSCWYYLRYCDPKNNTRFVSSEAERYWMTSRRADGSMHSGGVDLYIGGAEHAVLHLLYARFWHKVLFDLGHVSTPEPFGRLFHQGLIQSHAYQRPDGSLVAVDLVCEVDGKTVERENGAPVTQIIAKMSKTLKNVVNPDDVIADYGADTFRLYEMYMGPLEAAKPWNTRDIIGVHRFLQRAWRLAIDEKSGALLVAATEDAAMERLLHRTIERVGEHIERLGFNSAIACMIELVNAATRPMDLADPTQGGLTRSQLERFTQLLAPFAPHIAEEIWSRLGHATSVHSCVWPVFDAAMLEEHEVEVPVQVRGKVRARIMVPKTATAPETEAIALAHPSVCEALAGVTPKKIIVVAGRMVNIVV